jgi:hypothetical protein
MDEEGNNVLMRLNVALSYKLNLVTNIYEDIFFVTKFGAPRISMDAIYYWFHSLIHGDVY